MRGDIDFVEAANHGELCLIEDGTRVKHVAHKGGWAAAAGGIDYV